MKFTEQKTENHQGQAISVLTVYNADNSIHWQDVYNLSCIDTIGYYHADKASMIKLSEGNK